MYIPKKLLTIIKINTVINALYFALRAALFLSIGVNADIFITVIITAACGVAAYYLSENIWAAKGMLFMSFMLMLFVTDIIILIIAAIAGLFSKHVFVLIWLSGAIAFAATVLFLIYGLINERIVKKHVLTVYSKKIERPCRYAVISDIHFGTIQPDKILSNTIKRINEENYDGILLVGDIAEEGTSHDSLLKLFEELQKLRSRNGTYFVHGNHDRQEKLHDAGRTYSDEEFDALMAKANIRCIDDAVADLPDGVQLIGRNDYSVKNRKKTAELLENSDRKRLRILLEHQPAEYDDFSKDGVEVILSAHYHGAQNWPNNLIYKMAGMKYNGKYSLGESVLYVNAGLTGSKYKVRTHAHCEYLCLELKGKPLKV